MRRSDKWDGKVIEGEICTLENMGPLWIHINKSHYAHTNGDSAPTAGDQPCKPTKPVKVVKPINPKRFVYKDQVYGRYQYRVWDTREEVYICDWLDYTDYKLLVINTLGVDVHRYRPNLMCRVGYRIKCRYKVSVRDKDTAVEYSKGDRYARNNRKTGE